MSISTISVLFLCSLQLWAGELAGKKLIEFGWDEPDTKFLAEHIGEMQQTPFDGCVFHVNFKGPNGQQGSLTWQGWGTNVIERADLAEAMEDLRQIRFGAFRENFLRFNTTPAKLDWFDDYTAVIQNARLASEIARAGNCPGLLFDIEQYEGELFDYRKQRHAFNKSATGSEPTKSWELYAAQARKQGREIMQAFQTGYPGLTVFLTFGYSLPWAESKQGRLPLAECHYGLLAPFLDGMFSAARDGAVIVDGHELAYGWKEPEKFEAAYHSAKETLLPIVGNPEPYRRFSSIGFGLWLDRDWRKIGWNTEDPSKNYFTPQAMERATRAALERADKYVWIYSETPRWWSENKGPVKLPEAYIHAIRRAKTAGQ